MQGLPVGEVVELMPARGPRGDDDRLRPCRQGRKQLEVGNLHTDVVMLLLEAEGARHAAAAGVEDIHVQLWHQPQRRHRAADAAQCLLMAMAVQDTLALPGLQGELQVALLHLARQPGVGEMAGVGNNTAIVTGDQLGPLVSQG